MGRERELQRDGGLLFATNIFCGPSTLNFGGWFLLSRITAMDLFVEVGYQVFSCINQNFFIVFKI